MAYQNITVSKADGIGYLTMNNPKVLNALTPETTKELNAAIRELNEDPEVRVVITTGSGKLFVAGADISYMSNMTPEQAIGYSKECDELVNLIENASKPWIAAINGFALGGGCELALSCDIRICSDNAVFGQPEVGLGITPGFGGTQRLARAISVSKAKEMLYTGKSVKADEAYRIGLVNSVYPQAELMEGAMKLAQTIARNAPIAVRQCKKAVNEGLDMDLEAGLALESKLFGDCFETLDQREGMSAFLEKRKGVQFVNS